MDDNMAYALAWGAAKRMEATVDQYEEALASLRRHIADLKWELMQEHAMRRGLQTELGHMHKQHPDSVFLKPTSLRKPDGSPMTAGDLMYLAGFKDAMKENGIDPDAYLRFPEKL
ncbi:hypothetical protein [Microvirga sp. VF16]|uniref:hypothetical protein n=1 Tax=Microvirga sp. VF16 TaxID=2807101 RepID=UPI00193DC450|nr:hypothetical protein [Microvirga sp. VF16]QRM34813.1 hypothetical protein JO965_41875 [Microvirga sp. VF16]